jgi:histidinol-phosphatase
MANVEAQTEDRVAAAEGILREAGALTWMYFERGVPTEIKSDDSPVTIADREAEALLRRKLSDLFPGDGYIGEEHGEEPTSTGFRWVIDPIDATSNFIRKIPVYGNLLGLEYEGNVVAGLCYVPASRDLYRAQVGRGAFKNDGPIHVSTVSRLEDAQLAYPELRMFDRRGLTDFFLEATRAVKRSRGFGDYWNFLLLAEGSVDIVLEPYASVWDLAALKPIVEEAGGVFTDFEGTPTVRGGGAIAATPALHPIVMDMLNAWRARAK